MALRNADRQNQQSKMDATWRQRQTQQESVQFLTISSTINKNRI